MLGAQLLDVTPDRTQDLEPLRSRWCDAAWGGAAGYGLEFDCDRLTAAGATRRSVLGLRAVDFRDRR